MPHIALRKALPLLLRKKMGGADLVGLSLYAHRFQKPGELCTIVREMEHTIREAGAGDIVTIQACLRSVARSRIFSQEVRAKSRRSTTCRRFALSLVDEGPANVERKLAQCLPTFWCEGACSLVVEYDACNVSLWSASVTGSSVFSSSPSARTRIVLRACSMVQVMAERQGKCVSILSGSPRYFCRYSLDRNDRSCSGACPVPSSLLVSSRTKLWRCNKSVRVQSAVLWQGRIAASLSSHSLYFSA